MSSLLVNKFNLIDFFITRSDRFEVALLQTLHAESVTHTSPGQVIRAGARITTPWVTVYHIHWPSEAVTMGPAHCRGQKTLRLVAVSATGRSIGHFRSRPHLVLTHNPGRRR